MNELILIAMDRRARKVHEQSALNVANDGGGGYYQDPADIAACAADAAWLDDVDCPADSAHADYWISNYFESTGKDNNKFVLIARDRESYTNEELKNNSDAAYNVAAYAYIHSSAYAAYYAAYAAYYAADADAYSDAAYSDGACLEANLTAYFETTGEDRKPYIDAIKEGNK